MQRLDLFITDQQRQWLDQQRDKTGLAVADIIRRAIDEYRERRESLEPRPLRSIKEKRK